MNVFIIDKLEHIQHFKDEIYPLDGVCYYSNHFEDLANLINGKKREGNPSTWEYFGETIKNGA